MNLIKSQLTFSEVMSVARDIADSCFMQDEEGNDIDYSPACKHASIQVVFVENFTDFEFKVPENEEDKEEVSKVFDENYARYMAINIDDFTDGAKFNTRQWISILQSANELIDYRKQKLLNSINNKQNIEISNLVNNLVKKEIEVQDLQKKVLEQTEKINSQYNKEEITNMTNVFAEVNKLSQNPDYLRAVADAIHKENSKKKPQDHKKSQKKATSNFVETEFKEVMSDGE